MIEERYYCPHCNGWQNAKRYMPDSQGEFWLRCEDCNKMSDLPDYEIIAELKLLREQIERELEILESRNHSTDAHNPLPRASRCRVGAGPRS